MPEGKLSKLEHFELTSKLLLIEKLVQEENALKVEQQALQLRFGIVENRLQQIPGARADAILMRDSVVTKIGKRLKASGQQKDWTIHVEDDPADSRMAWPEDESDNGDE